MNCAFTPSSLTNDPIRLLRCSNCKRLRYYHSHHPGHGGVDTCPYPRAFCCSNWTRAFATAPPSPSARTSSRSNAQVEPGGMIVAGVQYARVEVDAARRLLRELGQRNAGAALGAGVRAPPARRRSGPDARARAPPRRAQAPRARSTLSRAPLGPAEGVRFDPNYTWPQAQARVNRAMGVRRRADAGEAELDRASRSTATSSPKLARDYPEQAERLSIPGSVEASRAGSARRPVMSHPDSRGRLRPHPRNTASWLRLGLPSQC